MSSRSNSILDESSTTQNMMNGIEDAAQEIPYTLDEDFKEFTDKDRTVKIVGFVDEVNLTKEVGKVQKHRLFIFTLNNNGTKRIQCLIWNDLIPNPESKIMINTIMHIDGAYCKEVRLTKEKEAQGYVPFELIIQKNTVLDYIGVHEAVNKQPIPIAPVEVDFDNIGLQSGLVKICGFVKTKFVSTPSRFENSSFGCGSITNGVYKITIQISNFQDIDLEKGTPIIVTGTINEQTNPLVISCNDTSSIEIDKTRQPMSNLTLMWGVRTPKRKAP